MDKNNLNWKIKESKRVIEASFGKWKRSAIAFTGGKDSTVLAHLIKLNKDKLPPVVFIDHELHFDETYKFVEEIRKEWDLDLHYEKDEAFLKKLVKEKDMEKKKELARMFKIKTIEKIIEKHKIKALFVGIRWDEHRARASEKYFSKRDNHWRVHPILHFEEKDIWEYIERFNLPYNPLYDEGYRSIGEKPFTKPVKAGGERAGREKDKEKIMERLRALGYF